MFTARTRRALVATGALGALLAVGACSGSGDPANETGRLTMWVRNTTGDYSTRLVDAYNEAHETQIDLTVIPAESYQQKVGAAAGANQLPDILAADVVYAPNYTKQGLFVDISDRIDALDFGDDLVSAHLDAASVDGTRFAVPHKVDSSVMFYNRTLFEKAGLDPDAPPTSYAEILDAARAIDKVSPDVDGLYAAGNCAGCFAYTAFANAYAGGHPVFADDGTSVDIDNPTMQALLEMYRTAFAEGLTPAGAKTDDGSTWTQAFAAGKIGIFPNGSYAVPQFLENADLDWDVAPLTDETGKKTGTFVGGDVLGVTRSSKNPDAAWDFVAWSLGDEAQVDIVAKNGDLPVRLDLADNEHTKGDPRIQKIAEGLADGYTPSSTAYGEAINDANGPWLTAVRGVVFGDDPATALATGQKAIESLASGN